MVGEGVEQTKPSAEGQPATRESIRGSRSFDEGVLSEIRKIFPDAKVKETVLYQRNTIHLN